MAEGIVVRFNEDRGFGFIRPDDESNDLYFHCTNQVVKEWAPSPGERVQFELGENNQGPIAIAIVLLSEPAFAGTTPAGGAELDGIVKWFDEGQGYGFIAGTDGADYFVHVSDIEADGYRCLADEEPVRFTASVAEDGRPKAVRVRSHPDRSRGTVSEYDSARGFGFIESANGSDRRFFHFTDILHTRGRETAVVGEAVEYDEEEGTKGPVARRVRRLDPRLPLFRFAYMGPEQRWLDELADLAEPETWDYREARGNEDGERGHDKPILWSYLVYTYARLEEENRESGDKIVLAQQENREWACFNTGLITPLQEEIFAVFVEDTAAARTGNKRRLAGFRVSSNRELLTIFSQLPKLANYFDDPSVLLYDRRRELHIEVEHVVRDNLHRFPPVARDNEHLARQLLHAARTDTERRVYRNYKTAIPQYYQGSVQLLLPLCLERKDRADLALVVARHGAHYRGETVLTLDMAYNNARLLTRPDDEWLNP